MIVASIQRFSHGWLVELLVVCASGIGTCTDSIIELSPTALHGNSSVLLFTVPTYL